MVNKVFGTILTVGVLLSFTTAQEKTLDQLKEIFDRNTTDPPVTTDDAIPCTCVPFYECEDDSIATNSTGMIDFRYEDDDQCSDYIDVCCKKVIKVDAPASITSTFPPKKKLNCGLRNPDGVGFGMTGSTETESVGITGSDLVETQFAEFPWMVAIYKEGTAESNPQESSIYQCGGTLIHPQVVVTAAHCVSNKTQFKIYAGDWDRQTEQEVLLHQEREVESIITHPQYYERALFNDIALLFLKTPVVIYENVDVVCLPRQNTNVDNVRCFGIGWGADRFGKKGQYQALLRKTYLPVVPRNVCEENLKATKLGEHFYLHKSFICAGGEQWKDTCKGDGGGPLVCPIPGENGRYQQMGIVSWGMGCGKKNVPGVYVDVAHFRDWIDEQMKLRNLETDSYQYQ